MRERNYGIDLLRIVSMLMVCTLHVLGQGGVLFSAEPGSANYETALFLETAVFGAANCYALISGYVGADAKFKYGNIIKLWLEVFFYTGGTTLLFHIFAPGSVRELETWRAFSPVMNGQYWYFTAYFGIFFFIPFFNKLINSLGRRHRAMLLLTIFIIFSVMPTLWGKDAFVTRSGYDALWLALMYLTGGCVKKSPIIGKLSKWVYLCIYVLCTVISYLARGHFIAYVAPTIFIGSIALVALFAKFKFPPIWTKIISVLSPLAFGVYLLHVHPLTWTKIFEGSFAYMAQYNPFLMVLCVLAAVFVVYIIATAVDFVRFYLFKLLRINKLCSLADAGLEKLKDKFDKFFKEDTV